MLSSMSRNGQTSYSAYEYAQPFQPLGQPVSPPSGPNYNWQMPTPMYTANPLPPGPKVQYLVGAPQDPSIRRTQSFQAPYYQNGTDTYNQYRKPHRRRSTHPSRKHSSYGIHSSYPSIPPSMPLPFPEPNLYPQNNFIPPPAYPGAPTYGISAADISLEPEHCTFLVDAVKEMDLCYRIFATWVEQLDRTDLGKKDKVETNIISMITVLADDAVKMLTASHNILASYRALARLMDKRLSALASSAQGGDLFATSSRGQAKDDFQTLSLDVHVHSIEISACVEKMQEGLHGLHDAVLRTHEKYSFRKKFWGWMCRLFRTISQGLFYGGLITGFVHPLGTVGTAFMHVGSSVSTIVASVCEKIKEAYNDEEKGINEVMKLLQGKIPKSMRVAQTSLEKFQAAHTVFRQHQRVAQGRASGFIAPTEAARARGNWHKAGKILELDDKDILGLGADCLQAGMGGM